ncbi:MAG: hypothetical protein AAGG48_18835 [Planctomycetota bacterium]
MDPPNTTDQPGSDEKSLLDSRFSLREFFGLATIVILAIGLFFSSRQSSKLKDEVDRLRLETGYLSDTEPGQIAAARVPTDQPLAYRVRIRVPEGSQDYRVAYSSIWEKGKNAPNWHSAIPVPPGESLVTLRILEDPRDNVWKISAILVSKDRTRRMATSLSAEQVAIFRGSNDVLRTGVGRETLAVDDDKSIRILDERWLVGEGGLLLYGDRAPDQDQTGVYAELQPDVGPLN